MTLIYSIILLALSVDLNSQSIKINYTTTYDNDFKSMINQDGMKFIINSTLIIHKGKSKLTRDSVMYIGNFLDKGNRYITYEEIYIDYKTMNMKSFAAMNKEKTF